MERTKLQQNELDNIEKHILISLFGSENIPNSTAYGFKLLNINPNEIIRKFEDKMTPIMKKDGKIDGKIIKKIIQLSKYSEITDFVNIPEGDFYLSDFVCSLIGKLIPGIVA